MGENTKIEWCDHTFNPWRGCQKVASGCANCYAESQSKRNTKTLGVWGPNGTRVVAAESAWRQVEKWDREARCRCGPRFGDRKCAWCKAGCHRPSVFCGSMCDVFEDWQHPVLRHDGCTMWKCHECGVWRDGALPAVQTVAPWCYQHTACKPLTLSDVRAHVFNLIDATPNLTWLLLTKRPENVRTMWEPFADTVYADGSSGEDIDEPPAPMSEYPAPKRDNVWLGTSIACQEDAERNIPELLKCRDLCRGVFLSIEPLIGPVDVSEWLHDSDCHYRDGVCHCSDPRESHIDQVIIGGESGPNARPCNIDWIRSIARQCEAAGVLCMVKQIGSNPVGLRFSIDDNGRPFCIENDSFRGGAKPLDKKGGDPAEWPEDLRKYRSLAWKGGV